jgi:membrane protein DedA with SNARE-associated domain
MTMMMREDPESSAERACLERNHASAFAMGNSAFSFDTPESSPVVEEDPNDTPRRMSFSNSNLPTRQEQRLDWTRRVMVIAMAACVLWVIIDAFTGRRLEKASSSFVEWVEAHPVAGILAVIWVYIVATICFVPGSVLTIGIGYAFGKAFSSTLTGVLLASIAVFFGASLGSICCLLLGRYLFREPVLRLAARYPVFQAVDRGTYDSC